MHDDAPLEADQGASDALVQFLYQAPIGLVQATLDGTITMINPMSAQLLMPLAGADGLANLFSLMAHAAPDLRDRAAAATWPGGLVCEGLRVPMNLGPRDDSGLRTLSLRMLRLGGDELMASVSDITAEVQQEQRRMAEQLRDASRVDALTGLPNRQVLLERIEQALVHARSAQACRFAVIFVNGDRFNRVNLGHGQAAGDELLKLMAARLGGVLRQRSADEAAPDPGPTLARLGADEFAVLLQGDEAARAAELIAQRLVDSLGKPYMVGDTAVHSSASVGLALNPCDAANAEAALQDALLAMREAKRQGGGRSCRFEPAMRSRAQRRASVESDLRLALAPGAGQLFVVYQPITGLADGRVAGVEALVRWQHPAHGVVPPVEFIEIAEETGLIVTLGSQVLRTACRQFMQWQTELGAQAPQVLSVNLSRAQLLQAGLLDEVRGALAASGMAPGCLQLEITESLAAEDRMIQDRLHQLKGLGLLLALDDFGTGYSSLSSLHQWPVDVIKIDRSFVSQIDTSPHHRVLVEATVLVARSLGMQTVAEGVETSAQAEMLTALRCDKVQGYFYARPLQADQATQWLRTQTPVDTRTEEEPQPLPRALAAERLLGLLENAHVAMALFDPEERLAYANRSFRQTHCQGLGAAPTWEAVMRHAHRQRCGLLIDSPDIDAWLASVRQRYRRVPYRVFESDFTDGRWMRVTEETTADGWQLCVMSDVTSLKANEAEMRLARDAALKASITDPLTGLPNRRHVFECLRALMHEAGEQRTPLAVAVIDIDLFKQINDRHGHGAGDQALTAFAHGLASALREGDLLGRIGGEEFLLVLPRTGRSSAERLLGQARSALLAQPLVSSLPRLKLNFSAGVAMLHAGESADALWQRADRGLLLAKSGGRGRDIFMDSTEPAALPRLGTSLSPSPSPTAVG